MVGGLEPGALGPSPLHGRNVCPYQTVRPNYCLVLSLGPGDPGTVCPSILGKIEKGPGKDGVTREDISPSKPDPTRVSEGEVCSPLRPKAH